MMSYADSRTLRQARYIRRAMRARRIGWLLMPLTMAAFSAAMWSDPNIRPKLMEGLDVVKPMIATVMEGEFSTEDARDIQAVALEKVSEINDKLVGLPAAVTPVNRPDTGG